MKQYKALFLDIDGTILRQDHTIEPSTKEAISIARQKGIEVFLATGRPLHEIYTIAEELGIHSFIGYNGAYALYQEKILVDEPISATIIEHYLKIAKQNHHEMILYTNSHNLLTSLETKAVRQFIDYFALSDTALYQDKYRNQILGITIMNVSPDEIALYNLDHENIYFSQVNVKGLEHSYDVIRENANKGMAIKSILEELHLSPDQAIAFGDGMNDKQMLQFVGNSFAMGNANPELFQYAKYRTTTVENSGIFNGLRKLGIIT